MYAAVKVSQKYTKATCGRGGRKEREREREREREGEKKNPADLDCTHFISAICVTMGRRIEVIFEGKKP